MPLVFVTRATHTRAVSTVLITAFEPFDNQAINASQQAMRAIDDERLPGVNLIREELPVVFGKSLTLLRAHIDEHTPDLVICLGEAGGRPDISLERVAINVDDARIPDNAGAQPIDEPIAADGPVGYWSTLPIKAILAGLREAGFPASISQTAGTYVCNHLFYGLMRCLDRKDAIRGGFVHVPHCLEQSTRSPRPSSSLPSETVARALEILIQITLETKVDIKVQAGAEH